MWEESSSRVDRGTLRMTLSGGTGVAMSRTGGVRRWSFRPTGKPAQTAGTRFPSSNHFTCRLVRSIGRRRAETQLKVTVPGSRILIVFISKA